MVAECDCQPQIQVGYKTVPFRHKDSYALQVLAGLDRSHVEREVAVGLAHARAKHWELAVLTLRRICSRSSTVTRRRF